MPKMVEINVSVSTGGKLALIDYGGLSTDYHLSLSERWNVEDLTEERREVFKNNRLKHLKAQLEPFAQAEFDDAFEQRAHFDSEGVNQRTLT